MPKIPPSPDFNIHVDPSCLTSSTDLGMGSKRTTAKEAENWKDEDHVEDKKEDSNQEDDEEQDAIERQIDRIEAQIQAAARAVVASIEQDYDESEDSVLSTSMDPHYEREGPQVTYDEGTELAYETKTELTFDGTNPAYESDHEHHSELMGDEDSSSHHDGDIDDDVFSRKSGNSTRSSLNSVNYCLNLSTSDDVNQGKELTSPQIREEDLASPFPADVRLVSPIPGATSYSLRDTTPITPSKDTYRPPFRTTSSVRAMQMSSPPLSVFSSPRSSKRHLPTVSRGGTPTSFSHSPSKKTPTRFRAKKAHPLVLLHATVMPLRWTYSHIISTPKLPAALQSVRDSWRLLQEKIGDTVLERGILLPHPQDSYEVLEERLLEALELPVRPHVRILKCGHYMGPETPASSDDENKRRSGSFFVDDKSANGDGEKRWCDICDRDVKLEGMELEGQLRFRMKIYASNGLMRAGAWAVCWREMERVDVEIEPFVESHLVAELENLVPFNTTNKFGQASEEDGDGFVDEDILEEHENEKHLGEEEEEEDDRRVAQEEQDMRKRMDEERMREVYGHNSLRMEDLGSRPSRNGLSRPLGHGDSLPELLLAAFKVVMRDKKNVAICFLSVVVLLLALRPGGNAESNSAVVMGDFSAIGAEIADSAMEITAAQHTLEIEAEIPAGVVETVQNTVEDLPMAQPFIVVEKKDPVADVDVEKQGTSSKHPTQEANPRPTPSSADLPSAQVPIQEPVASSDIQQESSYTSV